MSSFYVSTRSFLRGSEVRSLSPAYARTLKSMAGRVRMLAELATGNPTPDNDARYVIGMNPQGQHGVDMSGPPWGSAPRHCVAMAPNLDDMEWDGGTELGRPDMLVTLAIHVRPHAESRDAPYSQLEVSFRARLAAGTSNDVHVAIYRLQLDGTRAFLVNDTLTVSSTTASVKTLAVKLPTRPGHNLFEVALDLDDDEGDEVIIEDISIGNVAKRAHT